MRYTPGLLVRFFKKAAESKPGLVSVDSSEDAMRLIVTLVLCALSGYAALTRPTRLVFREALESLFIERMDLNEELFTDYMSNPELQDVVSKWLGEQVYKRFSEPPAIPSASGAS